MALFYGLRLRLGDMRSKDTAVLNTFFLSRVFHPHLTKFFCALKTHCLIWSSACSLTGIPSKDHLNNNY